MQGKHIALAVGILLCCGASGRAQYANFPLENGLPKLQHFHRYDSSSESLLLDDVREVTETVPVSERDETTGRDRIIPKSETRQIIERRTYRAADIRALSLQGDELKLSDVLAKLKADDPVIVITRREKLPAGYEKVLRDDVVILQIPSPTRFSVRQTPGYHPPSSDTRPILVSGDSVPTEERPRLGSQPVLPFFTTPPAIPAPAAPQRNAPPSSSYQAPQPTQPAPSQAAPVQPAPTSPERF